VVSFSSSNEEDYGEEDRIQEYCDDYDSTQKLIVPQEEEAKLRRIERILYNKRSSA